MVVNEYRTLQKDSGENYLVVVREHNAEEKFSKASQIFEFMEQEFSLSKLPEEYVYAIAADTKGKPIGVFEISHGSANLSVVSPREVFIRLLLAGAVSFFLVHNHPSGDPTPSEADLILTERMKNVAQLIGVPLLDHVIIGRDYFFSVQENTSVL